MVPYLCCFWLFVRAACASFFFFFCYSPFLLYFDASELYIRVEKMCAVVRAETVIYEVNTQTIYQSASTRIQNKPSSTETGMQCPRIVLAINFLSLNTTEYNRPIHNYANTCTVFECKCRADIYMVVDAARGTRSHLLWRTKWIRRNLLIPRKSIHYLFITAGGEIKSVANGFV